MPITETYVLTYENDEHRRYGSLCMEHGFGLRVDSRLRVGYRFDHPSKGHIVRLDRDSESADAPFEPTLLIYKHPVSNALQRDLPSREDYEVPLYPEHYSDDEWRFLIGAGKHGDKPSDFEMLSRELYLWLKVRPYSLNSRNVGGVIA